MSKFKILINQNTPSPEIGIFFAQQGHEVKEVKKQELQSSLKANMFDLCILDAVAGKQTISTEEVLSFDAEMPIMLLSSVPLKSREVIEAFSKGIDDLVFRPFDIAEVLCRVNAILRRTRANGHNQKAEYSLGSFVFNFKKSILIGNGETIKLTYKERKILELLCSYEGDTVQRKQVLKAVWGDDTYFNARSLDVYITRLRNYFRPDPSIKIINNRGVGYRLYIE